MPYTPRPYPKSVFGYTDFSELEKYKNAWMKFEEVFVINTLAKETTTQLPYLYSSFEEKSLVQLGQVLHTQAYPTENWSLV